MLSPIQLQQKQKSGGGLFGKVLGGTVGAIAGTFAGNPLAGAQAGMALGGTVGEMVKPGSVSGGKGVSLVANQDPEVQMLNIRENQKKLLQENQFSPEERDQLNSVFEKGAEELKKRMTLR
jgi:outer membrane lipoprotein SlyB